MVRDWEFGEWNCRVISAIRQKLETDKYVNNDITTNQPKPIVPNFVNIFHSSISFFSFLFFSLIGEFRYKSNNRIELIILWRRRIPLQQE